MDNDQILDVAEQALEQTEEVVERVVTVTKNNPFLIVGALVVGAGLGAIAAYKISKKKLELEFEEHLTEQIEKTREFYSRLNKEGDFATPESAVEALFPQDAAEAMADYQGRERIAYNNPESLKTEPETVEVEREEVVVKTRNVFRDRINTPAPAWDYDLEILNRNSAPDRPYVIAFDEYNEETTHDQVTYAYYKGDDTMANERDEAIDDVDKLIGEENLLRFGEGSGDPNVVYVRNDNLEIDFEIVFSNKSFAQDVLGMEPPEDIRHSAKRSRAFRQGRDE